MLWFENAQLQRRPDLTRLIRVDEELLAEDDALPTPRE